MALVARSVATASVAPALGGSRAPAGARNIASARDLPVEELSATLGASLGDAGRYLQDYSRPFSDRGFSDQHLPQERRLQVRLPSPRLNTESSQAFASMLEVHQIGRTDTRYEEVKSPSSTQRGPVARAINQYEFNAQVIAGTQNPRGGELNLVL